MSVEVSKKSSSEAPASRELFGELSHKLHNGRHTDTAEGCFAGEERDGCS